MWAIIALYVPLVASMHHFSFDGKKWHPYKTVNARGLQLNPVTVKVRREFVYVNEKRYRANVAIHIIKRAARLIPSPPIVLSASKADMHRAVAFSQTISSTGACDSGKCYFYIDQ